jgi:hypothetical protein
MEVAATSQMLLGNTIFEWFLAKYSIWLCIWLCTGSLERQKKEPQRRDKIESLGETEGLVISKKRQKESLGETEGVTKNRQRESQRRGKRSH